MIMKIYDNVLMKGLYMMATAALALTFAGCSKNDEPEDELKPEVHVGKVEVSSSQVVFPVDGGSKTIAVATNAEWHLDCDYTWMSFDADLNSGTVTISAEKNTTGADRYGVISVICGDEGYTDSRDIRVMQTYEPEDLVKDGVTANCYIAHTKASYRFPAKVKGNGAGDGNSKYIAAEGLEIKNAAFAELVWEAVPDGDKTRSTYVIDGEPMYDGENVYFSTGKAAGNAVIAVCAADGTILWSWHIWVTDDEITTKTDKNGLVWMDRNLGALSAKPSDAVNTRGLFYQWGRKDPFLPSAAEFVDIPTIYYADDDATANAKYAEQVKLRPSANVANQQKGDGVRRINAEKAVVAYSAPGNAVYAVQHPETFLTIHPVYSGGIKCDWYIMSPDNSEETDDQTESNLWGNTSSDVKYKSIFDPCPAGYVVPKGNAFATLGGSDKFTRIDVVLDGDNQETGEKLWEEDEEGYGWYWKNCDNAYFPKAGMLGLFGTPQYTCEDIYYWSADPLPKSLNEGWGRSCCLFNSLERLYFGVYYTGSALSDPSGLGARGTGASVRCVKE